MHWLGYANTSFVSTPSMANFSFLGIVERLISRYCIMTEKDFAYTTSDYPLDDLTIGPQQALHLSHLVRRSCMYCWLMAIHLLSMSKRLGARIG